MSDKYSLVVLSKAQWSKVIEQVKSDEVSMFILRNFANMSCTYLSNVAAFMGKIENSLKDRTEFALKMTPLTEAVKKVIDPSEFEGETKPRCYVWNKRQGCWSIDYDQTCNLRLAFNMKADPE